MRKLNGKEKKNLTKKPELNNNNENNCKTNCETIDKRNGIKHDVFPWKDFLCQKLNRNKTSNGKDVPIGIGKTYDKTSIAIVLLSKQTLNWMRYNGLKKNAFNVLNEYFRKCMHVHTHTHIYLFVI